MQIPISLRSKTPYDLQVHMTFHQSDLSYRCHVKNCEYSARSLQNLRYHFRSKHMVRWMRLAGGTCFKYYRAVIFLEQSVFGNNIYQKIMFLCKTAQYFFSKFVDRLVKQNATLAMFVQRLTALDTSWPITFVLHMDFSGLLVIHGLSEQ